MPLALQAALGFLQAIHYSAKAASANRECCCSLSRVVGKVRPLLEEVEFESRDDAMGLREHALERVATALEKAHVAVVRFSTMGNLQAILETEAMVSQFCSVCAELKNSLLSLGDLGVGTGQEWKEDLNRICGQLQSMNFESCSENRNTVRQVRQGVLRMQGVRMVSKSVYAQICSLLWRCQLPEKLDMTLELQGLRRELSRARAEKDTEEEYVLQQVIRAVQSSAAVPFTPAAPIPQPPVEYCCPISQQVMTDPVVLVETGQTYDRKSIEEWFSRGNVSCPVTGQHLSSTQLTSNFALKSLASTWVEVHSCEDSWIEDGRDAGVHVLHAESEFEAELQQGGEKLTSDPHNLEFAIGMDVGFGSLQKGQQNLGKDETGIGMHLRQIHVHALHTIKTANSTPTTTVDTGLASQNVKQGRAGTGGVDNDSDSSIPSKHAGLLSRIGGLLERLKKRKAEVQSTEPNGSDCCDVGSSLGTPEPATNLQRVARLDSDSKRRARPDSATSISMFKLESVASFPVSGAGSVTETDSEAGDDTDRVASDVEVKPVSELNAAAMIRHRGTPDSKALFKRHSRPDSATSMQLSEVPDNVLSFPISAGTEISSSESDDDDTSPDVDFDPGLAPETVLTPDSVNEAVQYRAQSVVMPQLTLEQRANQFIEHRRRNSWSGELPNVVSQFQAASHAPASSRGRLQLLTMALNASRQSMDFATPRNSHRRMQSDDQTSANSSTLDAVSCAIDLQTPRNSSMPVLTNFASPLRQTIRGMQMLEPSVNDDFHDEIPVERDLQEMVTGKKTPGGRDLVDMIGDEKAAELFKKHAGGEDALARWLELCPEDSEEDRESLASDSDSVDISKLLMCPFMKDLGSIESVDLTGSGAFDSTDWDGMSLGSEDDVSASSVDSGADEDNDNRAPSETNLSLSSLTTVASGGVEIVPVVMQTASGRKGKASPGLGKGAAVGGVDALLDGDDKPSKATTPFLLNLLSSGSVEVAMATAVELGARAKRDPTVQKQLSESGVISCLVQRLESPKRDARVSAARALALLGESSTDLQLEIIAAGAIPLLSQLTRAGSRKTGEAAGWAMNRLTAKKGSSVASTPDVSVPLLVDMLCDGTPEVKASAVMELSRTVVGVFGGYKEVSRPGVVQTLVELLSSDLCAVQQGAGDLLASLVNKNKEALQDLIETEDIVLRLLELMRDAEDEGKTAAAQVLKTLADNSEEIQQEVMKSGGIPLLVMVLKVGFPGHGGREACAWLLGLLVSRCTAAREEMDRLRAASVLEDLAQEGEAQEQVAAGWALHQLCLGGDADSSALSIPLIVRSLESGTPDVQVVAAWEVCHLASSNFWVQLELVHSDAVPAILSFLKAGSPTDGLNAALSALLHLASALDIIPGEICQQGGIPLLAGLCVGDLGADRKLVAELVTLLVDSCPVHQQELVSAHAVPLFVDMLLEGDAMCDAAQCLLMRLVDSELTAIASSVCSQSVPRLLSIIDSGNGVCAKEAAVSLLHRMVETNVESRQIVCDSGGMPVLLHLVNHGETHELKSVAANAMTKLAATDSNLQDNLAGSGAFGKLVQVLETTSTRVRQGTTMGSTKVMDPSTSSQDEKEPVGVRMDVLLSAGEKKGSGLTTIEEDTPLLGALASVQPPSNVLLQGASCKGVTNAAASSGGVTCNCVGLGHVVCSKPQDVLEQMTDGVCHDGVGSKSADGASIASCVVDSGPVELEKGDVQVEHPAVEQLVNVLRCGHGGDEEAAASALRSLATGNTAKRLELLNSGAVPLLVEMLQSKSFQ